MVVYNEPNERNTVDHKEFRAALDLYGFFDTQDRLDQIELRFDQLEYTLLEGRIDAQDAALLTDDQIDDQIEELGGYLDVADDILQIVQKQLTSEVMAEDVPDEQLNKFLDGMSNNGEIHMEDLFHVIIRATVRATVKDITKDIQEYLNDNFQRG